MGVKVYSMYLLARSLLLSSFSSSFPSLLFSPYRFLHPFPSFFLPLTRLLIMSQGHHNDDDDFGNNTGYKPGEKRSLAELNKLDAEDESLARWKASLGVASSGVSKLEDPHNVVVLQLQLLVEGRPDVTLDLTQSVEALKQHSFTIKEGVEYRLKVVFKVQHEVVSGLKYRQVVKRMGVTVDKSEEMIGSYAANPQTYEKKFAAEEAPSGMMARGHYEAKSKFVDDDGTVHKEWNWSFDIKKDW